MDIRDWANGRLAALRGISCRKARSVACSRIESWEADVVRGPYGAFRRGAKRISAHPSRRRLGESVPARRILLAWKDTRESRRAVRDALPFLKEAAEVMIAEVSELGTETESLRSVEDVAIYLRRHGVSVGAKVFLPAEQSVAGE